MADEAEEEADEEMEQEPAEAEAAQEEEAEMEQALFDLDYCLHYIGFTDDDKREQFMEEGYSNFIDFKSITEKDIQGIADQLAKRTVNDGRLILRLGQVRNLKALMHWIQDHYRCDEDPNHLDLSHEALAAAQQRA